MLIQNNQGFMQTVATERATQYSHVIDTEKQPATSGRAKEEDGNSVSISFAAQKMNESTSVYTLNTASGNRDVDLGTFFAPTNVGNADLLSMDNLLLPSQQNVAALQDHVSKVFPEFLAKNGIPEAPESIRYDHEGKMVLPADYPYADKLKSALANEPAMAKELSTVNALSSHVAALAELEPFQQEYDQAKSKAEIDAIIDKYSHLFVDNRTYPAIELNFNKTGQLSVLAEGKRLA